MGILRKPGKLKKSYMDYYSDTQNAQNDPYVPPVKRTRVDEDEIVVLKEKVINPCAQIPWIYFVGSLLGPQGSILKELSKSTRSKLGIFGKGSMKDKKKEQELADSDEAEHAHLKEPLHVLIDIKAPRAAAHRRMSEALVEIYKFMAPPEARGDAMQQQYNEGPYGGYGESEYGGYGGGAATRGPIRGSGPPRGRGGPWRGADRGRGGRRGAPTGGYGGY